MNKTIIVSNRLPLQIKLNENSLEVKPSVGGLATGMKSVHEDGNGIWIGWSGLTEEELTEDLKIQEKRELKKNKCASVSLTQQDIDDFYLGFSNKTLWPLFHYFMEYAKFENDQWEAYKNVNQKFADVVLEHLEDEDNVWIHDYQLLLLPKLIKDKKPNTSIGFFLHIPYPSYEIFRTFPWRKELLHGMLGADLIGFHTYDYERHFLSSVKRILKLEVQFNEISYLDRVIKVDSFPMGIDYKKFHNAAKKNFKQKEVHKSEFQKRLDEHIESGENTQLILSIDRMDYTKGIPNRIRAFEYFLTKYPQYKEQVRLVMLVVPSRSNVPQYKKLKRETDELVGRINGKFATVSWTPIWYFYRSVPFENLIDLYTTSHIALITPIRDGMNLVAKEFVATRVNQDGVIILSEMAGAANEMDEAILINPNNFEEISDALKEAIEMPLSEQQKRMKFLQKRLSRYSVEKWSDEFMKSLNATKALDKAIVAEKMTLKNQNLMLAAFKKAKRKLLFLDYDGTMVGFKNNPQDAKPDKELLSLLDSLNHQKNTDVVIVSGRDKETFQKWFAQNHII
jgi:trehalose 6-phosphate synthase/phosphatase